MKLKYLSWRAIDILSASAGTDYGDIGIVATVTNN